MVLSVLIHKIEFKGAKGSWSKFFDVFGKNALFVFALSGFLPKLLPLFRWVDHVDEKGKVSVHKRLPRFYEHVCKPLTAFTDNPEEWIAVVCTLHDRASTG